KQVRVYIDLNGNDQYDPGGATPDPAAFTQSDGSYVIETDATGTFEVRIDDAATPLTQTSPAGGAGIEVNFAQGVTTSAINFGVFDGRNQDFGDLFGYATLLSENGPRHVVLPNVRLGSSVDVDSDGFGDPLLTSSPDSFGDDFDATDDEDGVALVGTITEGSTFTFDVEAYGNGFVLNAWIDFDNDGEFEASEQIFTNLEDIQADSANPAPIPTVTAPTGAAFDSTTQFFAARFRWGPSGLGPTGAANAGEVEDYLLATTPPIAVTGQVRIDADGDSAFDGTDTAVAGATVYFDQNLNGLLDPEERRGVTDANGFYQILIDSTQSIDVTIRVDETSLDPTLESLVPVDGVFSQTVSVSQPVTANFLYGFPQGVSGVVFNDANNNGIRDGEPGFAGLTVNVFSDPDLDGVFDTLVGSAVTAADGSYTVPVPVVGSYDVALDLSSLEFVTQTTPAGSAQRVTVNVGEIAAGVDFGAFDAVPTFTQDYGDLIVEGSRNYPTTLADNGARHTIVPGVFLGDVPPDADPGTRESSDAQADDLLFGDDEDAVNVLTPTIQPSSTLTFEAKVNGSGAVLNAWVDFNNDGDWDDTGEQILTDRGATSGIITTFIVNTPADVDVTAQAFAARFRWGDAGLSYDGASATGEVEDYLIARVQTVGGVDGDFNGDNLVTRSDYDVWSTAFGDTVSPGTGADANGNGVVDIGDYTIWRDAFDAAGGAQAAFATSSSAVVDLTGEPLSPERVTALPPKSLATSSFDADAFAPMMLPIPEVAGAIDESLAVNEDEAVAEDALAAALLEWSLDQAEVQDAEDGPSFVDDSDGPSDEEAVATVGEALVL
ncbi:MAG: GEVED domain-containing protein, partial [Planctomycetota bacterium]